MMARFEGPDGPRQIRDVLRSNPAIGFAPLSLDALCAAVEVKQHPKGSNLIVQGDQDNAIAFLLAGEVEILVHGREVARRYTPNHVGEMAAIDPSAPRSATVRAVQDVSSD